MDMPVLKYHLMEYATATILGLNPKNYSCKALAEDLENENEYDRFDILYGDGDKEKEDYIEKLKKDPFISTDLQTFTDHINLHHQIILRRVITCIKISSCYFCVGTNDGWFYIFSYEEALLASENLFNEIPGSNVKKDKDRSIVSLSVDDKGEIIGVCFACGAVILLSFDKDLCINQHADIRSMHVSNGGNLYSSNNNDNEKIEIRNESNGTGKFSYLQIKGVYDYQQSLQMIYVDPLFGIPTSSLNNSLLLGNNQATANTTRNSLYNYNLNDCSTKAGWLTCNKKGDLLLTQVEVNSPGRENRWLSTVSTSNANYRNSTTDFRSMSISAPMSTSSLNFQSTIGSSVILHDGEGAIPVIAWRGSFIAFVTMGNMKPEVKVYDIANDNKVCKVGAPEEIREAQQQQLDAKNRAQSSDVNSDLNTDQIKQNSSNSIVADLLQHLKCHLYWESDYKLIIGWYNSVKVVEMVQSAVTGSKMSYKGMIMSEIRTDCLIRAVFPFDECSFAILGLITVEEDEEIEENSEEERYEDKERRIHYNQSVVEESQGLKTNRGKDNEHTLTRALQASSPLKQQQEYLASLKKSVNEYNVVDLFQAELQLRDRWTGEMFEQDLLPLVQAPSWYNLRFPSNDKFNNSPANELLFKLHSMHFESSYDLLSKTFLSASMNNQSEAKVIPWRLWKSYTDPFIFNLDDSCEDDQNSLGESSVLGESKVPFEDSQNQFKPMIDQREEYHQHMRIRAKANVLPPTMVLATPFEVVLVRVRDVDDRIQWVLGKKNYEAALKIAHYNRHLLKKRNFHEYVDMYTEYTLKEGTPQRYLKVISVITSLVGNDPNYWNYLIKKYLKHGAISYLAPFIPLAEPELEDNLYLRVLEALLEYQHRPLFLYILNKWFWGGQYASKISVSPENIELCLSQNHPLYPNETSSAIFLSDLLEYFNNVKTSGQASNSLPTGSKPGNIISPSPNGGEGELDQDQVLFNETKEGSFLKIQSTNSTVTIQSLLTPHLSAFLHLVENNKHSKIKDPMIYEITALLNHLMYDNDPSKQAYKEIALSNYLDLFNDWENFHNGTMMSGTLRRPEHYDKFNYNMVFYLISEEQLGKGRLSIIDLVKMNKEETGVKIVEYLNKIQEKRVNIPVNDNNLATLKDPRGKIVHPNVTVEDDIEYFYRELKKDVDLTYANRRDKESTDRLVLWYLDLLSHKVPDMYNDDKYSVYHNEQVELYAEFSAPFVSSDPELSGDAIETNCTFQFKDEERWVLQDNPLGQPSPLLQFLSWSRCVDFRKALDVCYKKLSQPLYYEIAYIYFRLGDTTDAKKALKIVLENIKSVSKAVHLVEAHQSDVKLLRELWNDLETYCLQHQDYYSGLLRYAGQRHIPHSRQLITKLPENMRIPQLNAKLLKIVENSEVEVRIVQNTVAVHKYDSLGSFRDLHQMKSKGVRMNAMMSINDIQSNESNQRQSVFGEERNSEAYIPRSLEMVDKNYVQANVTQQQKYTENAQKGQKIDFQKVLNQHRKLMLIREKMFLPKCTYCNHVIYEKSKKITSNFLTTPFDVDSMEREDNSNGVTTKGGVLYFACGHIYHYDCVEHYHNSFNLDALTVSPSKNNSKSLRERGQESKRSPQKETKTVKEQKEKEKIRGTRGLNTMLTCQECTRRNH